MSDNGFTRAVPRSDGPLDELVARIEAMIDQRVQALYPRLATVSRVNAGDGMIAVQFYDDDYEGQQSKARTAGVAYDVGDVVLVQPVSPTEWVVAQKMISNNQDRRAISDQEIRNSAIRGNHVQGNAITPAHLDRAYTTPAQLTQATNGLAPTSVVNTHVANLQAALNAIQQQVNQLANNPSGVTMAQVNQRLNDRSQTYEHKHMANRISQDNGYEVMSALTYLKAFLNCTYNSRNKTGNPCASQKSLMNRIG